MKEISVTPIDDFHTHLRQGDLMKTVTPFLESGFVRTALVMVNIDILLAIKAS